MRWTNDLKRAGWLHWRRAAQRRTEKTGGGLCPKLNELRDKDEINFYLKIISSITRLKNVLFRESAFIFLHFIFVLLLFLFLRMRIIAPPGDPSMFNSSKPVMGAPNSLKMEIQDNHQRSWIQPCMPQNRCKIFYFFLICYIFL